MSPADGTTPVYVSFDPGPGHALPMSWQLIMGEKEKAELRRELYDLVSKWRGRVRE
jgi:hypothetical protein